MFDPTIHPCGTLSMPVSEADYWQGEADLARDERMNADALAEFLSERALADAGWIRFIEDEDELVLTASCVAYVWPPEKRN